MYVNKGIIFSENTQKYDSKNRTDWWKYTAGHPKLYSWTPFGLPLGSLLERSLDIYHHLQDSHPGHIVGR